jgi:uncharacterized protein YciI
MQYIVIAYDCTDNKVSERRNKAREDHLKIVKEMFTNRKWLYACAILEDDGTIVGSMIVCDFVSREELKEQWLKREPYILGNVWEKIDIKRAQVAPTNLMVL